MFRARGQRAGADKNANGGHHAGGPSASGKGATDADSKSWRSRIYKLSQWLDAPAHSSTIAIFRMLYALCVLAQVAKWDDMFLKLTDSAYVFPYPGLAWIHPPDPYQGRVLLEVCRWSSLFQLIGLATPLSTGVAWLSFTWLFHICESHFNNHYIFMCHILFLGTVLGWGRWFSADCFLGACLGRRVSPFVPRWNVLLLRVLVVVPYFYGSIAKMNPDWMFRAQPITMWFARRSWPQNQEWFCWGLCWSGCLFDFVIGFLLFYRPTRYIFGFPGALIFNTSNKIMFNIGVFPLMMVASLVLFLESHKPAEMISWVMRRKFRDLPPSSEPDADSDVERAKGRQPAAARPGEWKYMGISPKQWLGLIFVCSFLSAHALYPLRHFVMYPGNSSWHEEGHFGAWHMKLRSKHGWVHLDLVDSVGNTMTIDPSQDPFLHRMQRNLFSKPHCLILYIGRLQQVFKAAGNPLTAVYANDCWTLNARKLHNLYKRGVNLLPFVGNYELIGVSGARQAPSDPSKWLWRDEEGPTCTEVMRPLPENGWSAGLERTFARAGIYREQEKKRPKSYYRSFLRIFHRDRIPTALQWHFKDGTKRFAYTVPMIQ